MYVEGIVIKVPQFIKKKIKLIN